MYFCMHMHMQVVVGLFPGWLAGGGTGGEKSDKSVQSVRVGTLTEKNLPNFYAWLRNTRVEEWEKVVVTARRDSIKLLLCLLPACLLHLND